MEAANWRIAVDLDLALSCSSPLQSRMASRPNLGLVVDLDLELPVDLELPPDAPQQFISAHIIS